MKGEAPEPRLNGNGRGNPRIAEARVLARSALKAEADSFALSIFPYVKEAQANGAMSLNKIARYLNDRGVRTPRGGLWSPTQVRNLLRRVEAL